MLILRFNISSSVFRVWINGFVVVIVILCSGSRPPLTLDSSPIDYRWNSYLPAAACHSIKSMAECYICGTEDSMMRRCSECNLPVCTNHRLPENHNCPALLEEDDTKEWFADKFNNLDQEQTRSRFTSSKLRVLILIVAVGVIAVLVYVVAL